MESQIIFGKSVQGSRLNNEDAMLARTFHGDIHVIAVADGMGGAEGGEIASSLVIKEITDYFYSHWSINEKNMKDHLKHAFSSAQSVIRSKLAEEPELKGMGTTLTCLLVYQNYYAWASIGDSRLYKLNDDGCLLLTNDHTYQNELIQSNSLEANINDYSHILTKVIDGGYDEPDIFPKEASYLTLGQQELFLVCSDGAIMSKSNNDHSWLYELATKSSSISMLADESIENALTLGSTDNITIALLNLDFYKPGSNKKKVKSLKIKNAGHSKAGQKRKWNRRAIILVLMSLSFISGWVVGTFPGFIPFRQVTLMPSSENNKDSIDSTEIKIANDSQRMIQSTFTDKDMRAKKISEVSDSTKVKNKIKN